MGVSVSTLQRRAGGNRLRAPAGGHGEGCFNAETAFRVLSPSALRQGFVGPAAVSSV
ncbi:hypothetical protein CLJ1_3196 [Pseudomonas paraeruginosa]|nr:hypothetical protein CLJ1_3196 [Pseudomonas aeruginosa]